MFRGPKETRRGDSRVASEQTDEMVDHDGGSDEQRGEQHELDLDRSIESPAVVT